ncbi:MAG TPA: hypothetical protein VNV65_05370 [Candidatus Solibacter sp.]|jgi:hypothetical protein|nr:hypothetical protein [Candidatus Solibacter sp.]
MREELLPHRAWYSITRPDGFIAGSELLTVERTGAAWHIESELKTTWPEEIATTIDWELDHRLVTRLLRIHSHERFSGDHELELTVTGNGLLAHRVAPDGPTQVELGWGPHAELDHLSAAFATVVVERLDLIPGNALEIDAVQLGTADLVPAIVPVVVSAAAATGIDWTVVATGHSTRITTAAAGAIAAYGELLALDRLEVSR